MSVGPRGGFRSIDLSDEKIVLRPFVPVELSSDPAFPEDEDPVGQSPQFVEVRRDEEDRDALGRQTFDPLMDRLSGPHVDPSRRMV